MSFDADSYKALFSIQSESLKMYLHAEKVPFQLKSILSGPKRPILWAEKSTFLVKETFPALIFSSRIRLRRQYF